MTKLNKTVDLVNREEVIKLINELYKKIYRFEETEESREDKMNWNNVVDSLVAAIEEL